MGPPGLKFPVITHRGAVGHSAVVLSSTKRSPCFRPKKNENLVRTQVVGVLRSWLAGLQEAAGLKATLGAVAEVLGQRAEPAARTAGPPSTPQVCNFVLSCALAAKVWPSHLLPGPCRSAKAPSQVKHVGEEP